MPPGEPSPTAFGGQLDRIVMLAKHPEAPANAKNQAVTYIIKQVTPAIFKWINKFGMNLDQSAKEECVARAIEDINSAINDWDPTKGASFFTYIYNFRLKNIILQEVMKQQDRMISLEQGSPFGESGENLPLSAIIPGTMEQTDPRFVEIQKAMERLSPQERQVVSLTFGFKDPQFNPEGRADLTQGEIGKEMGLGQMRINLILNQALEKLRSPLGGTWKEYNRDFSYPERTPFGEDELRNAMQTNGSLISFDYKGKKVSGYVVKTFIKNSKIYHRIYVPTQENFGDHFINVVRKDY